MTRPKDKKVSVTKKAAIKTGTTKAKVKDTGVGPVRCYLLLDRSSSMSNKWNETIGAINAYVKELSAHKETKLALVTLVTFDKWNNALQFETIQDQVPVTKWFDLTPYGISPRGYTPLNDAVGRIVSLIESEVVKSAPKLVSLVVMTDGEENASIELDKSAAGAALECLRKLGYEVTFLGVDFNAFSQARDYGTQSIHTISSTSANLSDTMRMRAAKTVSYGVTGQAMGYTSDEQDFAAGGRVDLTPMPTPRGGGGFAKGVSDFWKRKKLDEARKLVAEADAKDKRNS